MEGQIKSFIAKEFKENFIPNISEFVKIPNLSPNYDPEWKTNGNQEKAVNFLADWVKKQNIENSNVSVETIPGLTSTLVVEVDAFKGGKGNYLLYGHFDKQPHFDGWHEGLGPLKPVIKDGKLYGRGGADDGYAIFSYILALKGCQVSGLPHPKCLIILEGSEESGSSDLAEYLDHLKGKIGTPDVIVCLDSGCLDYKTLWLTNSLRGIVMADLKVKVLPGGLHSGDSSGIVPNPFRIARQVQNYFSFLVIGQIGRSKDRKNS